MFPKMTGNIFCLCPLVKVSAIFHTLTHNNTTNDSEIDNSIFL